MEEQVHQDVIEALRDKTGRVCEDGRYREAEQCYRETLAIFRRVYGEEHPDVATIYHNLGGLTHARGRRAASEPFARQAVTIRRLEACGY
jgi:hypothetical protein